MLTSHICIFSAESREKAAILAAILAMLQEAQVEETSF